MKDHRIREGHCEDSLLRGVGKRPMWVCLLVLSTVLWACTSAQADLVNGDFSDGLNSWDAWGLVEPEGGQAVFYEGDDYSMLEQVFTIPSLALTLSFDIQFTRVADNTSGGLPDAFAVSLLDPDTFEPLVSNAGYSEFYYWEADGEDEYVETVASVSGVTVSLDISGLRGLEALVAFDLLGGSDGYATTAYLDNVTISVVPVPGAFLLGMMGLSFAGIRYRRKLSL